MLKILFIGFFLGLGLAIGSNLVREIISLIYFQVARNDVKRLINARKKFNDDNDVDGSGLVN